MYRIMYDRGDKDYFVASITNTVNFGTYEEAMVFYMLEMAQLYYKSFPDQFVGARFNWKIVFSQDLFA
jgi:hypothetical protein